MSRNIFLSYSRDDGEIVEALVDDLERAGHHVWLDRQLSGGQEWWDRLLERIRSTDVFLLAVSEASLASIPCRREREYASKLGKQILPVIVAGDVSIKLAPPELARTQWVDYRNFDKEAAFELIRALVELPQSPPLPEELPDLPEVPVSYLTSLASLVNQTEPLSEEEQLSLVFKLRDGLDQAEDRKETLELLVRLRARGELLARAADEIDRLRTDPAYATDAPRGQHFDRPPPTTTTEGPPQDPAGDKPRRTVPFVVAVVAGVALIAVAGFVISNSGGGEPSATIAARSTTTSTIRTTTVAPPVTQVATTQPLTTVQPVDEDLMALLAEVIANSAAQQPNNADLNCYNEVTNYAVANALGWQFDGSFTWYWDSFNAAWLREDGLAWLTVQGVYQSFCTGRFWDSFTGQWG